MNIARQGLIFIIRIYQLTVSPVLAAAFGPSGRCRFTPSCSEYAREAIQIHGAMRGSLLAGWRLCRCHPWGKSGEDLPPPLGRVRLRRTLNRSSNGSTESRPTVSEWKPGHCHGS